ncbi:hypothetical protein E8L90_05435 [Brevibacillus antibioticus]|uniref:DUF4362 domain-containing protein n=1 Tax=Brevibacillus antibioticus TaxID=2570228 RepID=A0A4V6X5U5_9BACL|nr:hypothetical protein [Brevibacillus antibioticus]TKI54933.1 hypothetical protein E8L90_05435 [Brevibacillus antibioticus]
MRECLKGVIVCLMVLLFSGCHVNQPTVSSTETTQEAIKLPSAIWVQMYLKGSNKPQPELVDVINDKPQAEQIYKWMNEGTKDQSVAVGNIDTIFLLRFDFRKGEEPVESSTYLYIITTDKKLYAKQVVLNEKYNLDQYDSNKNSALVNEAGTEGWQELKAGVINKDVLYN